MGPAGRAGLRPGPLPAELDALARAYDRLGGSGTRPKLLVSSYFDHLGDALGVLAGAPVDGIGLDLTRGGARNLELLASTGGIGDRTLVAGIVDGRNVWANGLERSLSTLATLLGLAGEVVVSSSCSSSTSRSTWTPSSPSTPRSGRGWPSPARRWPR